MLIKLNKNMGKIVPEHDYELDDTAQYTINLKTELEQQSSILMAIQTMGLPALKDYHNWLSSNGFDVNTPNPTNEFVSHYYGKQALWKTKLSQGLVFKAEDDDDFYIIMECSRLNHGFKYTQIILTLGGCL